MRNRGEPRLYVVVAGTVQVPVSTAPGPARGERTVVQPWGRQAAQGGHAIGLFRYRQATGDPFESGRPPVPYQAITTIWLQARDSAELKHIQYLLAKKKIMFHRFTDTNPEYGAGVEVVTAFVTEPIYKDQLIGVADYLPLWSPK